MDATLLARSLKKVPLSDGASHYRGTVSPSGGLDTKLPLVALLSNS